MNAFILTITNCEEYDDFAERTYKVFIPPEDFPLNYDNARKLLFDNYELFSGEKIKEPIKKKKLDDLVIFMKNNGFEEVGFTRIEVGVKNYWAI